MDYRKRFFVDPAEKLRLRKLDPSYKGDHESEEAAKQETEHYRVKLAHQQALLYAQRKHSVLVVLQALDAGGKDVGKSANKNRQRPRHRAPSAYGRFKSVFLQRRVSSEPRSGPWKVPTNSEQISCATTAYRSGD